MSAAPKRSFDPASAFLFVASFVQAADNHLVNPLLPEFERTLGAAAADRLPQSYALGAAVLPFLVALLWKARARLLIAPAFALHAAAAFVFYGAEADQAGIWRGAIARAMAGAASGVLSFALLSFAADAADPTARSRRIAFQTAGFTSALVLGVPLGAWLAATFGPRVPFAGVGLFGAVLAMIAVHLTGGGTAATDAGPPAIRTPFRKMLADRRALFGLGAVFLVGAAVAGPASRLGLRLHEDAGAGTIDIGFVYLAAGLAPIAVMPFAGRLLRLTGAAELAAYGSVAFAAPALLMGLPFAAGLKPAGALFFVALVCDVLRRTGLQSLMAEAAPEADRARFLAVRGLVAQTGLAIGAEVAVPLHRGSGFFAVCAMGAALSVAGGLLARAAKPPVKDTDGK